MKYYCNYPGNKLEKQIYNPLEEEKKVLEFWTKEKPSETLQEKRRKENDGEYRIVNGPPFPTGSPHSGHILNVLMKDVFTRHARQKNLDAVSKFGFDCHGLPVEHEVDKKLEIRSLQDLYSIGASNYNEECRKFVERHESDWKNTLEAIGIATNLTDVYSTMSRDTMEGVWGVFKNLFDLGLVYKDTKVLPYSTGCFTHLSHFEADLNWKVKNGVAAIVALRIVESDVSLLIWTDSVWKLPANFAVCVNPTSKYVKIKMVATDKIYILSQKRLHSIFPNSNDFSVLEEIQGTHIGNLKYHPLFDYLPGSFTILQDDSVRDKVGTGIVALCPHFNQNEYRICSVNGLSPDTTLCPVDSCGRFTRSVEGLAGLTIEEASLFVIQDLQKRGLLVHVENVERRRQHCWRSDVPLIQKVASTWFLKVENLKVKLKANNSKVTWVPVCNQKLLDSHFDKLSDWPIGREKLWGTPIPIWSSPSGDEVRCVGSIRELLELANVKELSDLHKESFDRVTIPSSVPGKPPLRRVSEVFDCWFESGTLPILQQKNKKPADLFVEGQDQINGWFLTSSIISAALSLPAPSKTIVVHGLVQGSDGMKLSKRKYNHNDALKIAEKYGIDSLRLYLLSSPLVAGESYVLVESEVRKFKENLLQPFYKIVYDLIPMLGKMGWVTYGVVSETSYYENIFEKWIITRTENLVQFYESELAAFRLHLVIPRLIELLEQFHKWFIPARRVTMKPSRNNEIILYSFIFKLLPVLAPFAPFFTEHIFQIIKPWTWTLDNGSVHNLLLAEKSDGLMSPDVDLKVTRWQGVVEMVREARQKYVIPTGYRILELIVVHPLDTYLDDREELNVALTKFVNVNTVTRTTDYSRFGVRLKAKLKKDSPLNQTLTKDELKKISLAIVKLNDSEVGELIRVGSQDILEQYVSLDDVKISHVFEEKFDEKTITICRDDVLVLVKMNKDLGYYEEGTRIELVSTVQKFRKKAKVFSSETATVAYLTEDTCLEGAFEKFSEELKKTTHSRIIPITGVCEFKEDQIHYQESVSVKGVPVILYLIKKQEQEEE